MSNSLSIPAALSEGYSRFRQGRLSDLKSSYEALAKGQSPAVMVISCADSRVDPGAIFDTGPGELFIVRNVANLVPPYREHGQGELNHHGTSAAIEYAVKALGIQHIVVMGHGGCGGVGACLAKKDQDLPFEFIGEWLNILDDARDRVLDAGTQEPARQEALEHEGVRSSIDRLRGFPFVAEAMTNRGLQLHGAWFSIGDAQLHWLGDDGTFVTVDG